MFSDYIFLVLMTHQLPKAHLGFYELDSLFSIEIVGLNVF